MNRFRSCVVCAGLTALAVLHLTTLRASAWNSAGHRTVANIAYDRLDAATRAKVIELLKASPRYAFEFEGEMPDSIQTGPAADRDRWIFLQAAIWPDLVRPNPEYHIENWHFINLPLYLNPTDEQALAKVQGISPNMKLPADLVGNFPKELNGVQAVQFCMKRLTDPGTTKGDKALYLCWLMHVVGDLHQPLHATSLYSRGRFYKKGGDHGGNAIPTKQRGNLHALWDGLLGGSNITLNAIRGRTTSILEDADLKKAAEAATASLSPETWANESFKVAKDSIYTEPILTEVRNKEDTKMHLARIGLSVDELKTAGQTARQRAAQGGYRLAEFLKQCVNGKGE